MTVSVGCAFSEEMRPDDDLFKNADRALYAVKESGRASLKFYSNINSTTA